MTSSFPAPNIGNLIAADFNTLSEAEAVEHLAWLIDLSADFSRADGTTIAFERLELLANRQPLLSEPTLALLHYFRANAWSNRVREAGQQSVWDWEQPARQNQILELRRAVRHAGFEQLLPLYRWRIRTNLANELNAVGRTVDAIEQWDQVLREEPRFAKAAGARGQGLIAYAVALQNETFAKPLVSEAYRSLSAALEIGAIHEDDLKAVSAVFEADRANAEKALAARDAAPEVGEEALGDTPEEVEYRRWCLANRLFLNPLNDLGEVSAAARDSMILPTIVEASADISPPPIIGFYNQMKQEYVSARYSLYEALHSIGPHFSDEDVSLFNTLDYPAYGLATERLRTAFRCAYSILDKIAFFLNAYLDLGHKPHTVSFRSVWYEGAKHDKPLLHRFHTHDNWPLRGLFWLSKEFFEDDFKEVTEPDAEELALIRNQLEHRYLQLHSMGSGDDDANSAQPGLRRSMARETFKARTFRVFRYARSGLIYLSMAVRREEAKRPRGEGLILPMILDRWEDEWKE